MNEQQMVDAILAKQGTLTAEEQQFLENQIRLACAPSAQPVTYPGIPTNVPAQAQDAAAELRAQTLMERPSWSAAEQDFMGAYIARRARELGY